MTAQILSMHAPPSSEFGSIQTQFPQKMETSSGAAEPHTPVSPDGDDSSRGRRRDRDEADGENGDGADGGEGVGGSRKRRRSRKGLDKKFECPHEGCGKSYSRAEHLYRHQLNRKPPSELTSDKAPLMLPLRQSQANILLRLPRLQPVVRPPGPMCTPQGEAHGAWLAAAAERHVHAQSEPHCDGCNGAQEWTRKQAREHAELASSRATLGRPSASLC